MMLRQAPISGIFFKKFDGIIQKRHDILFRV
jgi:hypothetical protein